MTNYIDEKKVRNEMAVFLKNQDVLSTTERGVTAVVDESLGTLSSASFSYIAKANVRNIRNIKVGGTTLTPGTDYTVDYYFLDTTRKCRIDYTVAQTGVATVTYDWGTTEKIYPNFPRTDMTLASYPRVGLEVIDIDTIPYGYGNVNNSVIDISFTVVDDSKDNIIDIMNSIREAIVANQSSFYNVKLVKPRRTGPVVPIKDSKIKNKLFSKSFDVRASFIIESNN